MSDADTHHKRFELLIKLLKLTTSSNDAEALLAMRKANAIASEAEFDGWERILRGHVKVIADPFVHIKAAPPPPPPPSPPKRPYQGAPPPRSQPYSPNPQPHPTAKPQPQPQWSPPPQPRTDPFPAARQNGYSGICIVCTSPVLAKAGYIEPMATKNNSWKVFCLSCYTKKMKPQPAAKAAQKMSPHSSRSVKDVGDLI
jgi:outer membrane biosynthesis protein TonB